MKNVNSVNNTLKDQLSRRFEYLRISVTDRCNFRCSYCMPSDIFNKDYKYIPHDRILSYEEIIDICKLLKKVGLKKIRITGGEPLIYNMGPLTNLLINNKMKTHLETSGSYPLTGKWNWICLSPKKNKLPLKGIYPKANELKIIVYNLDDLKFAEDQSMKVNKNCLLYLQPEWSKRDKIMPIIVDYAMKNPKWRVSLQTHKYLNIP